jgi:hypothetical protein
MDDLRLARNLKKTLARLPEDQVRRVVSFVFACLENDWRQLTMERLAKAQEPCAPMPVYPRDVEVGDSRAAARTASFKA